MVEFDFEVEYLVVNDNSEALIVGYREDIGGSALFLINQHTGNVYFKHRENWVTLVGTERRAVIARFVAAQHRDVPAVSVQTSLFSIPAPFKFAS